MPIERLEFDNPQIQYHPLETAIHLTRYQLAKPFVRGKRVLDIACGEGYGSWLLKSWGAEYVLGVDIAEEAISSAKKNFSSEGIDFVAANAESLSVDSTFDVIVSLETIEHVVDQDAFLIQLKRLLAPNGIIVISCPNDRGAAFVPYYPTINPYHLREYTFKKFTNDCEAILGKASAWLLGTNVFGYGNFRYHPEQDCVEWSKSSLLATDITTLANSDTLVCHNFKDYLPNAENSIYYVGIWGIPEEERIVSGTIFPIKPFNTCINSIKQNMMNEQQGSLSKDRLIFTLKQRILVAQALSAELELIKQSRDRLITNLQQEVTAQQALLISSQQDTDALREELLSAHNKLEQIEALLTQTQTNLTLIDEQLKRVTALTFSLRFISIRWIKLFARKILPSVFAKKLFIGAQTQNELSKL